VEGGLARLRNLDTPDARSSVFAMLLLHRGREHALAWLDAHEATDPGLLTAIGWKNAAVALAEAGRWEDAAARLGALPDDMAVESPDMAYVRGVLNAALTLPIWARRFALTTQIIDQPVEPLQGAEIAGWHRRALVSFEIAKRRLEEVGEIARAAAAETWRAWLLLTDPSRRAEGERIVVDAMREGKSAIDYAQQIFSASRSTRLPWSVTSEFVNLPADLPHLRSERSLHCAGIRARRRTWSALLSRSVEISVCL
jgi:hypothetical protein